MISSLTGELRRVDDDRVHLAVGPMLLELLVPAADITELHTSLGESLTFHTVLYFQGDSGGGSTIEPRLIGFLRPQDKRFFEKFITVKGIGPKTALKALSAPVGDIAAAIERKDARFLAGLKGVGKRTAELIVAELAGKLADLASPVARTETTKRRSNEDEAAIAVLVSPQMGLRRTDAERLLEVVKHSNPELRSADELVPEMLRLHSRAG